MDLPILQLPTLNRNVIQFHQGGPSIVQSNSEELPILKISQEGLILLDVVSSFIGGAHEHEDY